MNRNKSFLVSIVFILSILFSINLSAENVVKYYNQITEDISGFNNYNLKIINYKWKATKYEASEPNLLVDIRNGYIKIEDQGTGGGTLKTEIALFKAKNGIPFIAVSLKNFLGIALKEYKIKIFKKSGNTWKDITSSILPDIKINDFLIGPPINHSVFNDIKSINILDFELPRFGTEIKVNLDIAWIDYYLSLEDTPEDAKKAYLQIKKNAVYKIYCLKWDNIKTKFVFSRKIKR